MARGGRRSATLLCSHDELPEQDAALISTIWAASCCVMKRSDLLGGAGACGWSLEGYAGHIFVLVFHMSTCSKRSPLIHLPQPGPTATILATCLKARRGGASNE